ncbi:MAG: hypothetical protein IJM57_05865 [Lachnospiraceae bacterium]|nr:hypothetical protein [Lachnospiraceae bacterium]
MVRFIIQKLLNKKWLILSILIGNILLIGIACCNPMYTKAALRKLLTKRMNNYLEENNKYPGLITIDAKLSNKQVSTKHSKYFESYLNVADKAEEMFGLKAMEKVTFLENNIEQDAKFSTVRSGQGSLKLKIASLSDMDEHVEFVAGTMYSKTPDADGTIECIINEKVYLSEQIIIGETVELYGYEDKNGNPLKLRVTGVFRAKDVADPYWVQEPLSFDQEFFIDQEIYKDQFLTPGNIEGSIHGLWYLLFDYEKIEPEDVPQMLDVFKKLDEDNKTSECLYAVYCNYDEIFEQFQTDASKVNATMWILQVPVLVLLAVFIFMVSNQVIDVEQGEIAMLKSRGVSRLQLILAYLTQSGILGAIALVIGIPLGILLCQLFGSTNAFLEFVSRKSMSVQISGEALLYAGISCLAGILIMTLPVLKYARFSIVEQKTHKRKRTKPLWQVMFLDFALLALALYGYYDFNNQKNELMKAIAKGEAVNPMLFFSASLFILSCAIVFLRVIPRLSSLIFRIGRKHWKPAAYASFLQIQRDMHKQSFITVFLVLTIALGIFNANIARTVNQNEEERIRYTDAADIVVKENWVSNLDSVRKGGNSGSATKVTYREPDYTRYEDMQEKYSDKVAAMTRVIQEKDSSVLYGSNTVENVQLMAINTYDFGNSAWMPEITKEESSYDKVKRFFKNLVKFNFSEMFKSSDKEAEVYHHWYEDLNALARNPEGAVISRNLAEKCDAKIGGSITIERFNELHQSIGRKTLTVSAIVDYWPGYENLKEVKGEKGRMETVSNYLLVCNYDNLLLDYSITPYEIWIKTTGSTDFFYEWAEEENISFKSFKDMRGDLLGLKNDPYFQITNGMLTLTFIVVLVLCAIGFLIFWITSIRSRELIFGIYRAMGMSMGELIRMLVNEHFFGSLLPILFGAGVGILASKMFLPLIQIAYSPKIETLPAKIVMLGSDLAKIAVVVSIMLAVCITVISVLLSKIKINQALKLGED